MTESPQQHEPNIEMTSTTNIDFVPIPDSVPELTVSEQPVSEQPVPELSVSKQVINNQSSTTNTFVEPETSVNDQPSSSNFAIQVCALADVCEIKGKS